MNINWNLSVIASMSLMAVATQAAVGPVQVEVDSGITYDSNIYANNIEESDFILNIAPMLTLEQDSGLVHLDGHAGVNIIQYKDNDDENAEDYFLDFSVSGIHRPDTKLTYNVEGALKQETSADPDVNEIIERDIAEIDGRMRLDLTVKSGVRVELGYRDIGYNEKDELGYIDAEDSNFRLDGLWYGTEKLFFTAGYRYREISYEESSGVMNIDSDTFVVGAEGMLGSKMKGMLEIGYIDLGNNRDEDFYLGVGIDWDVSPKTFINISGKRDLEVSATGQRVLASDLRLTAQQQLSETVSGNAYIGIGDYERDGVFETRKDDIFRIGTGVTVELTINGELSAGLEYVDRSSNSAYSDYERIRAHVNFLFGF